MLGLILPSVRGIGQEKAPLQRCAAWRNELRCPPGGRCAATIRKRGAANVAVPVGDSAPQQSWTSVSGGDAAGWRKAADKDVGFPHSRLAQSGKQGCRKAPN